MKIVDPSVEVLRTGLEKDFALTPEQFIEKVGRTCYKSEDKITPESAPKFVRNLINRGHEAMLEHWTLIFRAKDAHIFKIIRDMWLDTTNAAWGTSTDDAFLPKLRFTDSDDRYIISGNIRAWRDFYRAFMRNCPQNCRAVYMQDIMDAAPTFFEDLRPEDMRPAVYEPYLTPITIRDLEGALEHLVHHDVTLKFVCDRGVSHELARHRAASFAQESTRYCNYAAGKYGREITVVRPSWCDPESRLYHLWKLSCQMNEDVYISMIDAGSAPQEARAVLPNSLKTEVVVTGTMGHWHHFFGLRCGHEAQPDMRKVACLARDILQAALNNYIEKEN